MTTANLSPSRRRRAQGIVLALGAFATLGGLVTIAGPASADPPTPVVVTNTDPSGPGSLAAAIDEANDDSDASAIDVQVDGTINVASELTITAPVAITHSTGTVSGLILSGGDSRRIFNISDAGAVSVEDLTLSHGRSTGDGGAIVVSDSTLTLDHVNVESSASLANGGAVFVDGGGLTLRGAKVTGNSAGQAGGAVLTHDADTHVVGSLLSANTAAGQGGAIEATTAGGGGSLVIESSTIVGNTQTGSQVHGTSIGAASVNDSILADNVTGDDFDLTQVGGANVVTYSLVEEPAPARAAGLAGHGNIAVGTDPQLGNSESGAMVPAAASPVVDAGDPSFDPALLSLTTDARGYPRVSGDDVDMGNVELQYARTATLALQASSDTGSSTSDRVTNADDLTFDVTGAGPGESNYVELFRDGHTTNNTRPGDGWIRETEAPPGVLVYRAVTTGEIGPVVLGPTLTVTVDRTAPAAPVPDLAASSDLGTSDTDNLTSATTRTFDLTGVETGATVRLRQYSLMFTFGGPFCPPMCFQLQDTPVEVGFRTGNGTVAESHPPTGTAPFSYTAIQTDLAGNTGAESSHLPVTFDFTPPAVPNAPDLQAASDDGSSPTDNMTRQTSLTFDVSGIDSGATAKLIRVDGESGGEVASRVGDGAITDTNVPVGPHTYFVVAMDPAGNEAFDNTRSIVVTVQAQPVVVPPTTTTSTTSTTTPSSTTTAPPTATAPAKASNPTPQPGETVRLDSAPPAGEKSGPTFDTSKPAAAILVSTDGGDDRPMPQPTFTTNADGSTSVSVQVPADTPPGVYLVAVVGTAPNGTSRVIIVPVVVRRRATAAATSVAAAAVPARPVTVPAEARAVQASVAAAGGAAAIGDAVLHHGATLSVADGRLIVDHHAAPGTNRAGLVGMVGLVLAALVLFRRSTRRLRSIR